MADADIITALLNGRIAFQSLYFLFRVTAEPLTGPDVAGDQDFIRAAGTNIDGTGAGFYLYIRSPVDLERALEMTLS